MVIKQKASTQLSNEIEYLSRLWDVKGEFQKELAFSNSLI